MHERLDACPLAIDEVGGELTRAVGVILDRGEAPARLECCLILLTRLACLVNSGLDCGHESGVCHVILWVSYGHEAGKETVTDNYLFTEVT